ncbi:cell wall synthesis protein KRE9 precursor [Spathaspora passalidarum NRRL Y-27907]|uniref:Cell wall synthesis protein KRE9 n=1 Tax=Spathaspora passalidarum (strain NRRL Y-27907 / 11-Y1) TaxID=619300 RepID=G3AER8_SPAPN|nr:cell wall synthesis protein KRE9 precursor [Spathaspora passalidarum NRRL Y-27907]EGW35694.1 cell wall synthesis protein KRE9 precursor [Spathaspora passalidarum NRRL Y-27907]
MKLQILTILVSLLAYVIADVDISKPSKGDKFSGSSGAASVDIVWKDDASDSSDPMSLKNVKTYTISLCTGPDARGSIQCLQPPLMPATALTSLKATVSIKQGLVPDGYYYFQIYSIFANGGDTIHYSPRFQLTGMSGTAGTLAVTMTGAVPDPQVQGFDAAANINSAWFTIPYTKQTGKTRYAPMQTQPGSKVTATTWTMRFPTSSVSYYTTKAKSPVVYSTITPGWDYTAESAVNYATVAPYPTNWYPASERVSKATLSSATKKKRWLD